MFLLCKPQFLPELLLSPNPESLSGNCHRRTPSGKYPGNALVTSSLFKGLLGWSWESVRNKGHQNETVLCKRINSSLYCVLTIFRNNPSTDSVEHSRFTGKGTKRAKEIGSSSGYQWGAVAQAEFPNTSSGLHSLKRHNSRIKNTFKGLHLHFNKSCVILCVCGPFSLSKVIILLFAPCNNSLLQMKKSG